MQQEKVKNLIDSMIKNGKILSGEMTDEERAIDEKIRRHDHKVVNGRAVALTAEEIAERQKEIEINKIETLNNEYKAKRAKAYPSVPEQFDILYHQGYDAWKAVIAQVKAKHPKP